MKLAELFESGGTLYATLSVMERYPTRLRVFIDTNYDNKQQFLQAVRQFEMTNPIKSRQILSSGKYNVLVEYLKEISTGIDSVRVSSLRFPKTGIDVDASMHSGEIVLNGGSKPRYLFRYVDGRELQQIENDGYLQPSQFYGRIHASVAPESKYRTGGGALLVIEYHRGDGWTAKQASTGIYAVTEKRIPLTKVKRVI